MAESELLKKTRAYAAERLGNGLSEKFVFHNLEHTENVAKSAETIGRASGLSDEELDSVMIAAWLHDIGYSQGCEGHEQTSSDIALHLLKEWGASERKIADVQRTILATKMPQSPKDMMGMVLCDADLSHLSDVDLDHCSRNLRQEFESVQDKKFNSDKEWYQFNLDFLKNHDFFTDYGKQVLKEGKKKNIKMLKKRLEGTGEKPGKEDLEKEIQKLRKKLEKSSSPARGIETMFRTTSENHVTLSGMADTKANIMISINTIILSIIVGVLFRKIGEYPGLLIPALMLTITCLITIVLAILATRPSISSGKFTHEDIQQKKTNLLFFGNFHQMELKDYEWGMREMMKDYEYLYGSMIKDIYYLGKVLAKKYRLLRLSYTVFMFGFVSSIIGFIIAMMFNYQPYSLQDVVDF
jgi:predicted metal-dependent HD superfamily phosphohydrolase